MKDKIFSVTARSMSPEELSGADRELVEAAKEMTRTSYTPYSRFNVGAAIRMADGSICTGSNQENAAYPSGTCAERTACYHASATHPGMAMTKIAVAARNLADSDPDTPWEEQFQRAPISPCGACRQALLEYEHLHGPIEVLLYGRDEILVFPSVASLLPLTFTSF